MVDLPKGNLYNFLYEEVEDKESPPEEENPYSQIAKEVHRVGADPQEQVGEFGSAVQEEWDRPASFNPFSAIGTEIATQAITPPSIPTPLGDLEYGKATQWALEKMDVDPEELYYESTGKPYYRPHELDRMYHSKQISARKKREIEKTQMSMTQNMGRFGKEFMEAFPILMEKGGDWIAGTTENIIEGDAAEIGDRGMEAIEFGGMVGDEIAASLIGLTTRPFEYARTDTIDAATWVPIAWWGKGVKAIPAAKKGIETATRLSLTGREGIVGGAEAFQKAYSANNASDIIRGAASAAVNKLPIPSLVKQSFFDMYANVDEALQVAKTKLRLRKGRDMIIWNEQVLQPLEKMRKSGKHTTEELDAAFYSLIQGIDDIPFRLNALDWYQKEVQKIVKDNAREVIRIAEDSGEAGVAEAAKAAMPRPRKPSMAAIDEGVEIPYGNKAAAMFDQSAVPRKKPKQSQEEWMAEIAKGKAGATWFDQSFLVNKMLGLNKSNDYIKWTKGEKAATQDIFLFGSGYAKKGEKGPQKLFFNVEKLKDEFAVAMASEAPPVNIYEFAYPFLKDAYEKARRPPMQDKQKYMYADGVLLDEVEVGLNAWGAAGPEKYAKHLDDLIKAEPDIKAVKATPSPAPRKWTEKETAAYGAIRREMGARGSPDLPAEITQRAPGLDPVPEIAKPSVKYVGTDPHMPIKDLDLETAVGLINHLYEMGPAQQHVAFAVYNKFVGAGEGTAKRAKLLEDNGITARRSATGFEGEAITPAAADFLHMPGRKASKLTPKEERLLIALTKEKPDLGEGQKTQRAAGIPKKPATPHSGKNFTPLDEMSPTLIPKKVEGLVDYLKAQGFKVTRKTPKKNITQEMYDAAEKGGFISSFHGTKTSFDDFVKMFKENRPTADKANIVSHNKEVKSRLKLLKDAGLNPKTLATEDAEAVIAYLRAIKGKKTRTKVKSSAPSFLLKDFDKLYTKLRGLGDPRAEQLMTYVKMYELFDARSIEAVAAKASDVAPGSLKAQSASSLVPNITETGLVEATNVPRPKALQAQKEGWLPPTAPAKTEFKTVEDFVNNTMMQDPALVKRLYSTRDRIDGFQPKDILWKYDGVPMTSSEFLFDLSPKAWDASKISYTLLAGSKIGKEMADALLAVKKLMFDLSLRQRNILGRSAENSAFITEDLFRAIVPSHFPNIKIPKRGMPDMEGWLRAGGHFGYDVHPTGKDLFRKKGRQLSYKQTARQEGSYLPDRKTLDDLMRVAGYPTGDNFIEALQLSIPKLIDDVHRYEFYNDLVLMKDAWSATPVHGWKRLHGGKIAARRSQKHGGNIERYGPATNGYVPPEVYRIIKSTEQHIKEFDNFMTRFFSGYSRLANVVKHNRLIANYATQAHSLYGINQLFINEGIDWRKAMSYAKDFMKGWKNKGYARHADVGTLPQAGRDFGSLDDVMNAITRSKNPINMLQIMFKDFEKGLKGGKSATEAAFSTMGRGGPELAMQNLEFLSYHILGLNGKMAKFFTGADRLARHVLFMDKVEKLGKGAGLTVDQALDNAELVLRAAKHAEDIMLYYGDLPFAIQALRQSAIAPFIAYPWRATKYTVEFPFRKPKMFKTVMAARDASITQGTRDELRRRESHYPNDFLYPVSQPSVDLMNRAMGVVGADPYKEMNLSARYWTPLTDIPSEPYGYNVDRWSEASLMGQERPTYKDHRNVLAKETGYKIPLPMHVEPLVDAAFGDPIEGAYKMAPSYIKKSLAKDTLYGIPHPKRDFVMQAFTGIRNFGPEHQAHALKTGARKIKTLKKTATYKNKTAREKMQMEQEAFIRNSRER